MAVDADERAIKRRKDVAFSEVVSIFGAMQIVGHEA